MCVKKCQYLDAQYGPVEWPLPEKSWQVFLPVLDISLIDKTEDATENYDHLPKTNFRFGLPTMPLSNFKKCLIILKLL